MSPLSVIACATWGLAALVSVACIRQAIREGLFR